MVKTPCSDDTQQYESQGDKGDHIWEKATCQQPKTCSVCGKEKGDLGEHKWIDATCTEPETCKYCGDTKGEANGHRWDGEICKDCNEKKTETPEAPAVNTVEGCFPFDANEFSDGILNTEG